VRIPRRFRSTPCSISLFKTQAIEFAFDQIILNPETDTVHCEIAVAVSRKHDDCDLGIFGLNARNSFMSARIW